MEENINFCDLGNVKISSDVIASIAATAAQEVNGVAGLTSKIPTDIRGIMGMKNLAKGVRVELNNNEVAIDLYISLRYGSKIQEVAQKIQENVKSAVDNMTGMDVTKVNVYIQGINFETPEAEKPAE